MNDIPSFFVPKIPPENQEAVYADLAAYASCAVAPIEERVFSIGYTHDGDNWVATVGQRLRGERPIHHRQRRNSPSPPPVRLEDAATVLAIFQGSQCFVVVTDNGTFSGSRSRWSNPLYAGRPSTVIRFAYPKS